MEPTIIGVKELRTNLPAIAKATKRGKRFLVMKHHQVLFRIEPSITTAYTDDKKLHKKPTGQTLIDTFKDVQFKSGDPNLSKKIDNIVYGI